MATIKLMRTKEVHGVEKVLVHGEILNTTDTCVQIKVSDNVISHLGKKDWRSGDTVSVGHQLVESITE